MLVDSGAPLSEQLDAHMRKLRGADTQATAVAWMTTAYRLMERCIEELKDRPAQVVHERLVFVPERPKLEIVQSIPRKPRYVEPTVVYPELFLHPGLKPAPKAWTRKDTLALERETKCRLQRRGK